MQLLQLEPAMARISKQTPPADDRGSERLVQRYQVLSLAFADNAFPQNKAAGIFDEIAKLDYHLSIFTEVRANTPPSVLVKMKQAGVDTVQVGIESLSTRLLGKMNKGVRAIDNLCMMKHCEAVGIVCDSNLMLHFPSSDRQDVDETLSMLEFCRWYRPLKTVSFWLGLESPVYRFHRRFHIRSTFNHPSLKKLFPKPIADAMRFIIQGYRGDRTVQRKRWRPVEIKVRQWEADYATLQRQTGGRPGLIFREGGGFIIIEQHFPNQPVTKHRLSGTSARIYRYCQIPRAFEQIAGLSAEHGPQKIHSFLASMVDKQLMVSENNDYLSLACPTVATAMSSPNLIMAPLRGFTDFVFRNAFWRHFQGIDEAVAPFVTSTKGRRIKPSHLSDLDPEKNQAMPVVPQILSNKSDEFYLLGQAVV